MNLDVAIFAGGKATRLRGLWDRSKFLVPVGGVPLITRLMAEIGTMRPRRLVMLLDDRAGEIINHPSVANRIFDLSWSIENPPAGTASAFRAGVRDQKIRMDVPLMVLNHDTLPLYPLASLAEHHAQHHGAWATAAFVHHEDFWRDVYAGASVLSVEAQREIYADKRTHDFPVHLLGAHRYHVPGFIDVGTPEGFNRAKEWKR